MTKAQAGLQLRPATIEDAAILYLDAEIGYELDRARFELHKDLSH